MYHRRGMGVRSMLVRLPHLSRRSFETSGADRPLTSCRLPEERIPQAQRRGNLTNGIWNIFKENSKIYKHDMKSHACIFMESSECDRDLIMKMERWHISQIQLILQQKDFVEHFNNFQNLYKILRFVTNPDSTE